MDREVRHRAIARILQRIDATLEQAEEGFPHFADPNTGVWTRTPSGDWTGGFWCGLLWLAAVSTGESKYRRAGIEWARRLKPRATSQSVFKGFLFWYGAELGHVLLGEREAHEIALAGGQGLIDMYDHTAGLIPLGREAEEDSDVGLNEANIDALPGTVPLLFQISLDLGKEAQEIATHHVERHISLCVRKDGSVCQSATFDPKTGAALRRYTHKGSSDNSTWGRAQAWGMLGLTQYLARVPGKVESVAQAVSDWWLAHVPKDKVAFWDFDDPSIPFAHKDTSATAIAAASLLKLAQFVPQQKSRYWDFAAETVDRLVQHHLTPTSSQDGRPPGILTNGCFNRRTNIGTAHELVWGDYFLLEALLVLDGRVAPQLI